MCSELCTAINSYTSFQSMIITAVIKIFLWMYRMITIMHVQLQYKHVYLLLNQPKYCMLCLHMTSFHVVGQIALAVNSKAVSIYYFIIVCILSLVWYF